MSPSHRLPLFSKPQQQPSAVPRGRDPDDDDKTTGLPPPPSPPRHVHSERRRGEVHARPLLPLRGPLKSSEATHTACSREQVVLQQTGDEFRIEACGWCQGIGTSFQGPAAAAAGCVCLFQTFGQSSVCLCQRMPVYTPTRRHGIVRRRGGGLFSSRVGWEPQGPSGRAPEISRCLPHPDRALPLWDLFCDMF